MMNNFTSIDFILNQNKENSSHNLMDEINYLENELLSFQMNETNQDNNKNYFIELKFTHKDSLEDIQKSYLKSKLNLVLTKGQGKASILLGMNSNGDSVGLSEEEMKESLDVLNIFCNDMNLDYKIIKYIDGFKGKLIELLVCGDKDKFLEKETKTELRIGMFGDQSAGKSTLIGVVVNGILDDGNGLAKSNIYRFQHEQSTGKTSNFSHYVR